jgi:hypothetical protein
MDHAQRGSRPRDRAALPYRTHVCAVVKAGVQPSLAGACTPQQEGAAVIFGLCHSGPFKAAPCDRCPRWAPTVWIRSSILGRRSSLAPFSVGRIMPGWRSRSSSTWSIGIGRCRRAGDAFIGSCGRFRFSHHHRGFDRWVDAPSEGCGGWRVLERQSHRRSFAITMLTARKEHVRKTSVDRAISILTAVTAARI